MNRFLYTFIIVCAIKVGLSISLRQSTKEVADMIKDYDEIETGVRAVRTFEDSLAGNENFRKRLLDTISTASELRQAKASQAENLKTKIEKFQETHRDRDGVILKYRVLHVSRTIIDVIFVCLAIPFFIFVIKRRR